jgi:hypothetical protein
VTDREHPHEFVPFVNLIDDAGRAVSLMRYVIPTAHLVEYFLCRPDATTRYILKSLADGLEYVGTGGNIMKLLVGLRVLHDRAFALLELFHKITRPTPEKRSVIDCRS